MRVEGAGCRVQGPGFRVQSSGCRVQGAGPRVQGAGFRVQGAGCRVQGRGFRVQVAGCRVQGPGFRVQGAERRVQGSEWRAPSLHDGLALSVRLVAFPQARIPAVGGKNDSNVSKRRQQSNTLARLEKCVFRAPVR